MYLIVEFTDTHETALIPDTWMSGENEAFWPPIQQSARIEKAVRSKELPTARWQTYPVRIMYQADDYDKARKKLPRSENASDLHTESAASGCEGGSKRKRNLKKRRAFDESSGDDYGPPSSDSENRGNTPAKRSKQLPTTSNSTLSQEVQLPVPPPLSRSNILSCSNIHPRPKSNEKNSVYFEERDIAKIFTLIEEVKTELREIKHMIGRISNTLPTANTANAVLPEGIEFPVPDRTALMDLETLLSCKENESRVIANLRVIGGTHVGDVTRRLLKHIIAPKLTTECNWTGLGGKVPFGSLRLKDVVLKLVRLNRETEGASNAEIEVVIKSWMRLSADRHNVRLRLQNGQGPRQGRKTPEPHTRI